MMIGKPCRQLSSAQRPLAVLLFFVYGVATTLVRDNEPGYWSQVSERMFGLKYYGWTTIPWCFGLLLGISLVFCGILKLNSFGREL
jgi:hypothetical protein